MVEPTVFFFGCFNIFSFCFAAFCFRQFYQRANVDNFNRKLKPLHFSALNICVGILCFFLLSCLNKFILLQYVCAFLHWCVSPLFCVCVCLYPHLAVSPLSTLTHWDIHETKRESFSFSFTLLFTLLSRYDCTVNVEQQQH
jgi:amino acid permease